MIFVTLIIWNLSAPNEQFVVMRTEPASYDCVTEAKYLETRLPPGTNGRATCFTKEQADVFIRRGSCVLDKSDSENGEMVYEYTCRIKLD